MKMLLSVACALLLLPNLSVAAPPTMEIKTRGDGIEIRVGNLEITGKSCQIDQAKQRLIIRGAPAVVVKRPGEGDPEEFRGAEIRIDLANGKIIEIVGKAK
jgi:hypothetical protein